MNRIALLIPIVFCMTFEPGVAVALAGVGGVPGGPVWFVGVLVLMVVLARMLAWRAAELTHERDLLTWISRLFRLTSLARVAALAWTGAGLYVLGWGFMGARALGALGLGESEVARTLFVALPGYIAWLALYWAEYPAQHATRDAAIMAQLEAGLPVREAPSVWRYLDHQLRVGPGALLSPMLAVLLLRDGTFYALKHAGVAAGQWLTVSVYVGSLLAVFVFSPVLLTRVLRTYRLPDDDLRRRLEGIAARANVRFRDLLLWDTSGSTGNALVTGVLPQFRYVLLSDVLVETMTDEQIEAVFAHELGHIVHRHIAWYAAFLVGGSLVLEWLPVMLEWGERRLAATTGWQLQGAEFVGGLGSIVLLLGAFGFVSRWSERQADVYAARAIGTSPETPPDRPLDSPVAAHGAAMFGSALCEVARLNHMPVSAWGFLHGSVKTRVQTLREMAAGKPTTARFDRWMVGLKVGLGAVVVAGLMSLVVRGMR